MQLITFNAPTIDEAMAQLRDTLGSDAMIISTYESRRGRGAQVTAVEEQRSDDTLLDSAISEEELRAESMQEPFVDCLNFHNVPKKIVAALSAEAFEVEEYNPTMKLAHAIDKVLCFSPLPNAVGKILFLVGPPGSGKTTTTARIAARSVIAGQKVSVITTDTVRAGAFAQLDSLTKLLNLDLACATTPRELSELCQSRNSDITLVDTPSTNVLTVSESDDLKRFVGAVDAEITLVLSATSNPDEAGGISEAFSEIGARYLHTTQLDCTRRVGSLLSAAYNGNLRISEVSATPYIGKSLSSLNPISLARLLMHQSSSDTNQFLNRECRT